MNAISYFLTASAFLLVFYGCYWLLRRNTFFGLNRAYLLVGIGLSLLLPFIPLPDAWVTGASMPALTETVTLPVVSVGASARPDASGLSIESWGWLIYGIGVAVMLVRLVLNVRGVFQLIGTGTTEQRPGYTLVRLPETPGAPTPSFSFGSYLVLNATDAQTEPDALMRHEEAHIRQHHTADVLFVELVGAAFWFNPVLWLYKRAVQEIHEFLADRAASDAVAPIKIDYPRQLVAYALDVTPAALVTPFVSVSTLKQRIVMLKKPQSNRRALLQYALVLPVAALLTLCTQPDRDQPKTEAQQAMERANARKPVNVDGPVFTVVEQQPEFPGGMAALGQYLAQHIKYPAAAQKANASGRVFVNFVVTKTGEITDVNLLKGIGFGADEEAMRVVREMPRWKPAKQDGKIVNVRYNLPINFAMEDEPVKNESSSSDPLNLDKAGRFYLNGNEVTKAELQMAIDAGRAGKSGRLYSVNFDSKTKTISLVTK